MKDGKCSGAKDADCEQQKGRSKQGEIQIKRLRKARDNSKQGDAPMSSTVKAAKALRVQRQTASTVKEPGPEPRQQNQ